MDGVAAAVHQYDKDYYSDHEEEGHSNDEQIREDINEFKLCTCFCYFTC